MKNKNNGRYGYLLQTIIVIVDFLCLNLAFFLVYLFSDANEGFVIHGKIVWLLLNFSYVPVAFVFSHFHNERIIYADRVFIKALMSIGLHALIFGILILFLQVEDVSNKTILLYFFIFFVLLSFWWVTSRLLLKRIRRKGMNFRRIIIVGAGKTGQLLYKNLQSDAGYGYKFMGFFDDNISLNGKIPLYRGTTDKVEEFALAEHIDEIYCALPGSQDEKILRLIRFTELNMIRFYIIPEINRYVFKRMHYHMLGDVPVLTLRDEPLENPFSRFFKRSFDIIFSLIVLLFSPFWLLPAAIAVKLSSPGPVFFVQRRTGYKGREFNCYKFRTMRVNNDADHKQATRNDPRKTKIGEFFRKTNIDELPQFINVLRGDMSVVGPRPHMLRHTADYSKVVDKYMVRHFVRPGLTGWAQVNGLRGETKALWQMERRVEFDVWYIENWNFWLDIKIIFKTIVNALRGEKNAF
ncbi:undecaprenyl-phosphate glucose phosphotransferase [Coprobacter tertius]|uniref:Undecaprenyl-phosphate glucose phosphotransferase n=1 Tax=Coprobacter tertius TaxID=2944915 RepID=A0ABT1MEG7_9BACT|nr:undecaprenyl-phosphate glucose phosphotransferase [Coprobacter tertius]MCP9611015.1 undecaprenyl-phosphate glucose phosphotransferase [Coprobacter tertius]